MSECGKCGKKLTWAMPSPNGLCTECYEKTAEADRQVEVREINEAKQKKDMEIESILVSTETNSLGF